MRLRATILLSGKKATGIEMPAEVVSALGSTQRPPVRVTVKGYTYRTSIASMGGKFMLGLNDEVRKGAGVAAGETYDFNIVLDDQPREVELPQDFKAALDKDAKAKKFFETLKLQQQAAAGRADRKDQVRGDAAAPHRANDRGTSRGPGLGQTSPWKANPGSERTLCGPSLSRTGPPPPAHLGLSVDSRKSDANPGC